jgi:hypothetical protein
MAGRGVVRELAPATTIAVVALLGASLAVRVVLPWQGEALALCAVMMGLVGVRSWHDHARNPRLRRRLASTFTNAIFAGLVFFFAGSYAGAPPLVLAIAAAMFGVVAIDRARLRGEALPAPSAQGEPPSEPNRRVAFEGTVHAIGEPAKLPVGGHEVALWVAQQGKRRWDSSARIELRDEARRTRVWLDLAGARVRGDAWVVAGPHRRETEDALAGLDREHPLHVWSFREGTRVFVLGGAKREADPARPGFRDPEQVNVFTGEVLIGLGHLSVAQRRARLRVVLWGALTAAAAASSIARGLGAW